MNVSLTQQYLLCALDDKGAFASKEAAATLPVVAMYELVSDGYLHLSEDGTELRPSAEPTKKQADLLACYTYVEERRVVNVQKFIEHFSGKGDGAASFLAAVADPLRDEGLIKAAKNQVVFVPAPTARKQMVDTIEKALDGKAEMTRDVAALLTFVLGAGLLDKLFNREARRNLERVLKDGKWDTFRFATTPEGKDTFLSVHQDIEKRYAPMVRYFVANN